MGPTNILPVSPETFLEETHSKLVSISLVHLLTFDFYGFFVECV